MLAWALTFLVLALIAALFGFGGIASAFASVAQVLFFVFLVVFLAMAIMHLMRGPKSFGVVDWEQVLCPLNPDIRLLFAHLA